MKFWGRPKLYETKTPKIECYPRMLITQLFVHYYSQETHTHEHHHPSCSFKKEYRILLFFVDVFYYMMKKDRSENLIPI